MKYLQIYVIFVGNKDNKENVKNSNSSRETEERLRDFTVSQPYDICYILVFQMCVSNENV